MPNILISDQLSPAAVKIFEDRGLDVDFRPGLSPDQLCEIIDGYDGLAIRSMTKVTESVLVKAARLKVVGRAGIGIDNVDVEAATRRGVVVMNTPFGNSVTTAEHAIAMLMSLCRQIPAADRSIRGGKWSKSKFVGMELYGKTLGLVGCGNIGSIVAERAIGLKMKAIAFDPFLAPERADKIGVERVDLETLLRRADIISLHTPLTDQTRNIISAQQLAAMKPGARLINCARGGLVDESALAESLKSGHLAGAALDVFAEEPPKASPLFEFDNVVATPHLGASTSEAQENVAIQVAEQMSDYILDGTVTNALNMPSISADEAPKLKPYTHLAEQLGHFAGKLTETGLCGVTITYAGHASTLNAEPLTQIILKGLLTPLMASVNMVNAPAVAAARNIKVTTAKTAAHAAYQTLICLEVETERGKRDLHGTLFQGIEPRIVRLLGIDIEAKLGKHMLYLRNNDRPGFIGDLGKLMGDAEINIATFHLGRNKEGGEAIALIEIDSAVPPALLKDICNLPNVLQAKAIRF